MNKLPTEIILWEKLEGKTQNYFTILYNLLKNTWLKKVNDILLDSIYFQQIIFLSDIDEDNFMWHDIVFKTWSIKEFKAYLRKNKNLKKQIEQKELKIWAIFWYDDKFREIIIVKQLKSTQEIEDYIREVRTKAFKLLWEEFPDLRI